MLLLEVEGDEFCLWNVRGNLQRRPLAVLLCAKFWSIPTKALSVHNFMQ